MEISKRDYFASKIMASIVLAWNQDQSKESRERILNYYLKEYGNIPLKEAFAKGAYDVADAMIKESEKYKDDS